MRYKINITERAGKLVKSMSFKELLNQLLCEHVMPGNFEKIKEYGSMFFHPTPKAELKKKIKMLKDMCEIPPLVTTDMENGPGMMIQGGTEFPHMLGCGIANSTKLAYTMGESAAMEGKALGYNWTLSPCADLLITPDHPWVTTRAAGSGPEHVIKILKAYIHGLQENNVIATLKHFPGDGYDIYDQHLTIPENPLSMKDWRKISGKVFKDLINDGAMSVMIGHISLPAYDTKNSKPGIYPPASLSKKIMTGLLKEELGFDGLIVSDAVNMGGMISYMNYYEACARFFECGGDVLLFPRIDKVFYKEMESQFKKGNLKEKTLRNRAERIISLKEQIGLFENNSKITVDKKKYESCSKTMVDKSVTLVRDRNKILPQKISKKTGILHLILTNDSQGELACYQKFTKEIRKYTKRVKEMVNPGHGQFFFNDVYNKKYDLIICSIGNRYSYGTNVIRLHGDVARGMMQGWMKLGTPVIFVAHNHPFMHVEYKEATDTIINTYGSIDYTFERLMKGIIGKVKFINKKKNVMY